ncbi:MAG: hypothetical protein EPN79_10705 [Burkholderiaceae bacterium]|nr:MAG: hypothetical protein EPN79_10705 [Burkholderiaceae bacterium]TBR76843.1 MAG: hypothetical protein EPN64_06370 [Burkholderiaceae bacterium]
MSLLNPPAFITLTGADDSTNLFDMRDIARCFPVEWGILLSPERRGQPRFPSHAFINSLRFSGLKLSAHICGAYSRDLIKFGDVPELHPILNSGMFTRAQINTNDAKVNPKEIARWAARFGITPILQCRNPDHFPDSGDVKWLFDCSGGRGQTPERWPLASGEAKRIVGYAGGIGPDNIEAVVRTVGQRPTPYWLDMESRIRDRSNRLDIEACQRVCTQTWGQVEPA